MNKLTKVGCSALCGSLAAISAANAGDLTVTGGVDMSWVSLEDAVTGNPIGIGSNLTFKGSGELDNGWKFDLTVANTNGSAYSSSNVNLDMGGLGQINIDQGDSGNGVAAYDDKMPTAWEEPWGAGLSTGVKTVVGAGSAMNIMYTTPKVLGITIAATMAPNMGTTDTADKLTGGGGTDSDFDKAYDLSVNINPSLGTEILSGLNVYAAGHSKDKNANGDTTKGHYYEGVAGITYDVGPVSVGFARSGHVMGLGKTTGSVSHYTGAMYGVAFNINDDLSVSYGFHNSRKAGYATAKMQPAEANRRVEVESFQIAYTMGGASLRLAQINGDNLNFSSTNDKDATVVSVSLAF